MSQLPSGVERRSIDGREWLATKGAPIGDEPAADGWRAWRPDRSKLAAMIESELPIALSPDDRVLYLGAAAGTTVSYLADVVDMVYAVEFAPRPMQSLIDVAETRPNVIPLLKDARQPETYAHVVESDLDLIVQDVATRNPAAVAVANRPFLAEDGALYCAIKARSMDVTADPTEMFDAARTELESAYTVNATTRLDPLHIDHLGIVASPVS